MDYSIITENDISQWNDKTGELYHFPSRYLKFLTPGTKVICYKGKIKNNSFKDKRLTSEPHYFGTAIIKKVYKDNNSKKNDYFAELISYVPFAIPVIAKQNNEFIEIIPSTRTVNYWRDGVRTINEKIFNKILELSDIDESKESNYNDIYQGLEQTFESTTIEGKKKLRYSSFYERKPIYRQQALIIHGYTCMGCGFNFEKKYGEIGKGYIHVHHLKPISESGETIINPKTDLNVLCANCHSIVHRQKNKTLSLAELKLAIKN